MKSAAHGLKAGSQVRRAPTLLLLLLGWAPQPPCLLWRLSRRVMLELLCDCLLSSMLAILACALPLHAGSPLHCCCCCVVLRAAAVFRQCSCPQSQCLLVTPLSLWVWVRTTSAGRAGACRTAACAWG